MQPDELARTFSSLSPNGKATFLTRIAHEQTIHARAAYLNYANDPTDVDAAALRLSNEFIHKLCGHTLQCLRGTTTAEQDASFVAMILHSGYSTDDLSQWLAEAKNSK
jgi:hypothetical protein